MFLRERRPNPEREPLYAEDLTDEGYVMNPESGA